VDNDPSPIEKLEKRVTLHHLFFGKTDPKNLAPLENVALEI
jgi:hypothetical protein